MKRFIVALCLLLCFSCAQAENAWVVEAWEQVSQKLDCDGMPLIIDAKVLQPRENATVQEFHLERLSDTFMVKKGKQIDWSLLDCDTSKGAWHKPSETFPEYQFISPHLYPSFSIGTLCSLTVQNMNPAYVIDTSHELSYDISFTAINDLTEDDVRACAERIAQACGYQLGDIVRMHRGDQVEVVRESMNTVLKHTSAKYTPDPAKAEEYLFFEVYYPVYFNGLRLYSGTYANGADEIEIPNMNLRMAVSAEHGLIFVDSVIIDPAALEPLGEAQPAMSADQAIQRMQDKYTNMFLPGIKQMTVQQLAMEYVPMSGDLSASKGFTLYPAWVARVTYEMNGGETYVKYEAYHAITGKPLF